MTKKGDTAMYSLVTSDPAETKEFIPCLDSIARDGAKKLLAEALQLEVSEYIDRHRDQKDSNGQSLVVRNGKAKPRKVTLGSGTIELQAPRVNDRRAEQKFTSQILPPYLRKSAKVESLLPILYLKGLSTNNFKDALEDFFGEGVSGLSSSSISSLKKSWENEFNAWNKRFIHDRYVYIWADGVNVKIRLGEDKKQCLLVIIGVKENGKKELIAVEAGYRESTESWQNLLRSLKERGLQEPLLAIGDGALGFWKAIRSAFPKTKEQRCWVHKIANVLDKLPKRLHSKAKELLHEMMRSPTQSDAYDSLMKFKCAYKAKYKSSYDCLEKDWPELMSFFSFSAANWDHIRTTNPIESTFATVKLRTYSTKGAGSAKSACAMAFKLMQEAEKKWLRIRGYEELKLLLSGVEFEDGVVVVNDLQQKASVS
jgi:putative transposase